MSVLRVPNPDKVDFRLEFAPDPTTGPGFVRRAPGSSQPFGVSIFAALRQQLGLRLEPAKGPVDVLVIESVERRSGN